MASGPKKSSTSQKPPPRPKPSRFDSFVPSDDIFDFALKDLPDIPRAPTVKSPDPAFDALDTIGAPFLYGTAVATVALERAATPPSAISSASSAVCVTSSDLADMSVRGGINLIIRAGGMRCFTAHPGPRLKEGEDGWSCGSRASRLHLSRFLNAVSPFVDLEPLTAYTYLVGDLSELPATYDRVAASSSLPLLHELCAAAGVPLAHKALLVLGLAGTLDVARVSNNLRLGAPYLARLLKPTEAPVRRERGEPLPPAAASHVSYNAPPPRHAPTPVKCKFPLQLRCLEELLRVGIHIPEKAREKLEDFVSDKSFRMGLEQLHKLNPWQRARDRCVTIRVHAFGRAFDRAVPYAPGFATRPGPEGESVPFTLPYVASADIFANGPLVMVRHGFSYVPLPLLIPDTVWPLLQSASSLASLAEVAYGPDLLVKLLDQIWKEAMACVGRKGYEMTPYKSVDSNVDCVDILGEVGPARIMIPSLLTCAMGPGLRISDQPSLIEAMRAQRARFAVLETDFYKPSRTVTHAMFKRLVEVNSRGKSELARLDGFNKAVADAEAIRYSDVGSAVAERKAQPVTRFATRNKERTHAQISRLDGFEPILEAEEFIASPRDPDLLKRYGPSAQSADADLVDALVPGVSPPMQLIHWLYSMLESGGERLMAVLPAMGSILKHLIDIVGAGFTAFHHFMLGVIATWRYSPTIIGEGASRVVAFHYPGARICIAISEDDSVTLSDTTVEPAVYHRLHWRELLWRLDSYDSLEEVEPMEFHMGTRVIDASLMPCDVHFTDRRARIPSMLAGKAPGVTCAAPKYLNWLGIQVSAQARPLALDALLLVPTLVRAVEIIGSFLKFMLAPVLRALGFPVSDPAAAAATLGEACDTGDALSRCSVEKLAALTGARHSLIVGMQRMHSAGDVRHPVYLRAANLERVLSARIQTLQVALAAAEPRMEPVVLVLCGAPGTGKDQTAALLARHFQFQGEHMQVYYRNPSDAHWSGFAGQKVVVYQEMFANKETRNQDATDFLMAASSATYLVSAAEIEGKGQPFAPYLMIMTTNMELHDNVPSQIVDPSAVNRRFSLIVRVTAGADGTPSFLIEKVHANIRLENAVGVHVTYDQLLATVEAAAHNKWETFQGIQTRSRGDAACPFSTKPRSSLPAPRTSAAPPPFVERLIRPSSGGLGMRFLFPSRADAPSAGAGASAEMRPSLVIGGAAALAAAAAFGMRYGVAAGVSTAAAAEGAVSLAEPLGTSFARGMWAFFGDPISRAEAALSAALAALSPTSVLDAARALWDYLCAITTSTWSRCASFVYYHRMALLGLFAMVTVTYGVVFAVRPSAQAGPAPRAYEKKPKRLQHSYHIVFLQSMPRAQSMDPVDLDARSREIGRSLVTINVSVDGGKPGVVVAIHVGDGVFLTTAHPFLAVPAQAGLDGVSKSGSVVLIGQTVHELRLEELDYLRTQGSSDDLILFRIPLAVLPPSAMSYFADEQEMGGSFEAFGCRPLTDASLGVVSLRGETNYAYRLAGHTIEMHTAHTWRSGGGTKEGDCGMPWVSAISGKIIGIHVAGGIIFGGGATPITADAIKTLKSVLLSGDAPVAQSGDNIVRPGMPVHRATDFPDFTPYQTISRRTSERPTPMFGYFRELAAKYGTEVKTPILSRFTGGPAELYPPMPVRRDRVFTDADKVFIRQFDRMYYPPGVFPRLTLLDALAEMPKDTSPAMPYLKHGYNTKRDLIEKDGELVFAPMFVKRLRAYVESLVGGPAYPIIATSKAKDELLKESKTAPRVIEMMPAEVHVALVCAVGGYRQHLIATHGRTGNRTACGINPYSREWAALAARFSTGKKFAGDCVTEDRNTTADSIELTAEEWERHIVPPAPYDFSWTEQQFLDNFHTVIPVGKLINSLAHVMRLIQDTVYEVGMSNPSGNYITVQINDHTTTMHLALGIRDILADKGLPCAPRDVWNAADWVTFGDDVIGVLSPNVEPGALLRAASKRGLPFTWDDKKEHPDDYEPPPEEITFLKRAFHHLPDKTVIAPLEKRSILSCLAHMPAGNVKGGGVLYSARVSSMLPEAALWGEDFYSDVITGVRENLARNGNVYCPTGKEAALPTYAALRAEMLTRATQAARFVPPPDEIVCGAAELPLDFDCEAQSGPARVITSALLVHEIWQISMLFSVTAIIATVTGMLAGFFLLLLHRRDPAPYRYEQARFACRCAAGSTFCGFHSLFFLLCFVLGIETLCYNYKYGPLWKYGIVTPDFKDTCDALPWHADPTYFSSYDYTADSAPETPSTVTGDAVTTMLEPSTSSFATATTVPTASLAGLLPPAAGAVSGGLMRQFPVAELSWTQGQAYNYAIGGINFPDALLAVPYIADRVRYFKYMRAGVEVSFKLNGNAMLYGTLLASWDPTSCLDWADSSEIVIPTLSGNPHVLLEANDSDSAGATIPYMWPFPAIDLQSYVPGSIGTVDILVLNPLTPVSTSSSSASITVTVYARFVGLELSGPTDTVFVPPLMTRRPRRGSLRATAQSRPRRGVEATAEAKDKSTKNMAVSLASKAAGAAVDFLSGYVPEPIMSVANTVASWFGFDMPRSLMNATRVTTRLQPELFMASGLDFSSMLARQPSRLPVSLKSFTPGVADEESLVALASTPCLLANFTINNSIAPNSTVFSAPVNPRYNISLPGPNTTAQFYPTLLSKAAMPFQAWRGTTRLWFNVSCSSFHSFRLRVGVVWGDTTGIGSVPPENGPSVLVDINGPTTFGVDIPFVFPRPYATESIGTWYVQLAVPPGPIGDVPGAPAYVNTYVCSAGDFEVMGRGTRLLIPAVMILTTSPLSAQVYPRSEVSSAMFVPVAGDAKSTLIGDSSFAHDSFACVADVVHGPEPWLGALPKLPTQLVVSPHAARQWELWFSSSVGPMPWNTLPEALVSTGAAAGNVPMPTGGVAVTWQLSSLSQYTLPQAGAKVMATSLDHFADCYKYQRGGYRIKAFLSAGSGALPPVLSATACAPTAGFTMDDAGTLTASNFWLPQPHNAGDARYNGSGAVFSNAVEAVGDTGVNFLEAEVPFESMAAYHSTSLPSSQVPPGVVAFDPWSSDRCVRLNLNDMTGNSRVNGILRSAADDHRFFYIKGPKLSYLINTPTNMAQLPGAVAGVITPSMFGPDETPQWIMMHPYTTAQEIQYF